MLLGFLFLSILASKTGISLVLRSVLVVILGSPNNAVIEFTLQDLGIIKEHKTRKILNITY